MSEAGTGTLAAALGPAIDRLAAAGVPEPARDARRLLAHAAGIAPDRLSIHMADPLGTEAADRFAAALAARARRQPVAQITGGRAFWGRDFRVTADVLDPRPETETLVAAALEAPFARLLDLGTGSGCLAVTLLAERPAAQGVATDISEAALAVARENAERHRVADRLQLLRADWWSGVAGAFDLIVANPPYIPVADLDALAPELRLHEPRAALTDGSDGLSAYRALAAGAVRHLAPGGRLAVEVGAGQAASVARLFAQAGLDPAGIRADMDGRQRVVIAQAAS